MDTRTHVLLELDGEGLAELDRLAVEGRHDV